MTAAAAFADLEGLLDLVDGNTADMCATLLSTLTDLYLQRPIHTPEDGPRSPRGLHPTRRLPYPSSSGWRAM